MRENDRLCLSEKQPFRRMLVKLKREIITMKKPAIRPELGRAPFVDAPTLKAWLDRGHDDEADEEPRNELDDAGG